MLARGVLAEAEGVNLRIVWILAFVAVIYPAGLRRGWDGAARDRPIILPHAVPAAIPANQMAIETCGTPPQAQVVGTWRPREGA